MRVKEVMTREVRTVAPDTSLQEAARQLAELDAGILPVEQDDRLIGMVTDRDIAVRGVAAGLGPDARVEEVLTREVKYCLEDDDISDVAGNMAQIQVRRMPVVNQDKRLTGIVSLADVASAGQHGDTGRALEGVTRRGGQHNQGLDGAAPV